MSEQSLIDKAEAELNAHDVNKEFTPNYLFNLDWRDFMAKIPDDTVDLVATDPAYESMRRWEGIGTTARMGMGKKGTSADDASKFFRTIPNDDLPDLVQEIHRILKPERHAYIMSDWETLKILHACAIEEGVFAPVGYGGLFEPCKPLIISFDEEGREKETAIAADMRQVIRNFLSTYHKRLEQDTAFSDDADELIGQILGLCDKHESSELLIWDKVAAGMGYTYRATHEFVFMLWKGKKRQLNDKGISDVLRFKRIPTTQAIVPTQKPIELFELLIKQSTQEGELVCDPFMGSGTVAIAASRNNRQWTGTELDEENHRKAKHRIETDIRPML